ncbi:MAG: hypothetical protein JEY91_19645, partial [Spirochaetaceae bacterium]|nr:hypothetical protein [Spirochaetaceae bacterium]
AEYKLEGYEEDINSKQDVLNQLLENQKINPNNDTELLLKKYQEQFVRLQNEKEVIKSDLLDAKLELTRLNRESDNLNESLKGKYNDELNRIKNKETRSSEIKIIVTQLVLLVILLILGIVLFLKFKKTKYLSPVLGYNFAITIILLQSIYIHSPFKLHYYTFITIGIAVSIILIVWLIKNLNKLSKKELLSLSKKNLIKGKCPNCSSTLSLKALPKEDIKGRKVKSFLLIMIIIAALFGNGSGIVIIFDSLNNIDIIEILVAFSLIVVPWLFVYLFLSSIFQFSSKKVPEPDQFNNKFCPVCGLTFILKCKECGEDRHNLLPYCSSCGDKIIDEE